MSIADQLIPVGSLVLGIALSTLRDNAQGGKSARADAREAIAEIWRYAWAQQDESYIELQVYLGRLRSKLTSARVPPKLIDLLTEETNKFWQAVEDSGDPDVGHNVSHARMDLLKNRVGVILRCLDESWLRRRSTARHPELTAAID